MDNDNEEKAYFANEFCPENEPPDEPFP